MRGSFRAPATRACVLAAGTTLLCGATAQAAQTVTASKTAERACHERYLRGAAGTDVTRTTASATGLVQARLAGRGDWDLAVFDARSRRYVAGSAAFRSNELAEGFVRKGQRLLVQACRFRGEASSVKLTIGYLGVKTARATGAAGKVQLVRVKTPDRAAKQRLQDLDLDLTEHGGPTFIEVVLHGAADRAKLDDAGFDYSVEIADLAARAEANRKADRRFAAEVEQTGLPSGRAGYRRLADYEAEMKLLALQYPGMVRPFTLPHKTVLGRDVNGIEIARNAAVYEALGERMTSHNGYSNIPSFGLYDTTGTTEDWTFWTAGSLGFTFEIGPEEFHPPYEQGVVDEYLGRGEAAGADKGGNREAYYEMLESTADRGLHSRITGEAPEGSKLTLTK